jgi:hypothetical protein
MRRVLILAGLAFLALSSAASAQSDAGACREILDSLIRLRCYDDVTKPSAAKPAVPAPIATMDPEPNFGRYPTEIYRGRIMTPDFRGRDSAYAMLRTRIRDGAKAGPELRRPPHSRRDRMRCRLSSCSCRGRSNWAGPRLPAWR